MPTTMGNLEAYWRSELLGPQWQDTEVLRPGARTGKGGNPHHYLVDGIKCSRVTTILNKTIPKPALVHWAKNAALDNARASLLSAPTLTGVDYTAWVESVIEEARARPDKIKDEAANWGTRAHAVIQQHIDQQLRGVTLTDVAEEMQPTIAAFIAFEASLDIQWRATEMVVWDTEQQVAGSVDAIGYSPKNGWIMCDWKTGKDFYAEMSLQLSAYAAMFENITGERIKHGYVVRFPKDQPEEGPTFAVKEVANLRSGWARYKCLILQAEYNPWTK